MSQFTRPKHGAKKDANHAQIMRELAQMVGGWQSVGFDAYRGFVHGVQFVIVDTSQHGGLTLDTRLYVGDYARDVEIKTPDKRNELTEGEKLYFELTPETGKIVTTAEEYYQVILELVKCETIIRLNTRDGKF